MSMTDEEHAQEARIRAEGIGPSRKGRGLVLPIHVGAEFLPCDPDAWHADPAQAVPWEAPGMGGGVG